MKYYTTSKLSENIHETPEGFLICIGVPIARTGDMVYGRGETPIEPDAEGRVVISRDEDEVFRPETIASFEGKAFTISHPDEFVGPDNWSDLAVGVLQNVRRGEGENKDDLLGDILVTDAIAIGLVKKGMREVSCGYEAEYHETGRGRGKQTNIIGNHLALVDQGRAGPAYAINDHTGNVKGVPTMKKTVSEKIKAMFAKAADEAASMVDADLPIEKKAGDEEVSAMDELKKMVSDLGEKISAMSKPADEQAPPFKKEEKKADDEDPKVDPKEKKADDAEEGEGQASIEDRLKALEAAVSKLMEGMSQDSDAEEGEEVVGDEDGEEDIADAAGYSPTGDTAARAEILAPGIQKSKDIKAKALKVAYGTAEGKKVIDSLTGGKAPTFDSAEKVDSMFVAASELLKVARRGQLSDAKKTRDFDSFDRSSVMTAEKMNEINAKFYNVK